VYAYRGLSVLDIGCGDGADLDLFRNVFGPKLKTFGIEPAKVAAELARERGHRVETGLFPGEYFDNENFDITWSKHVIEHVASPQDFLGRCRELLSESGLIILDTPNTDSPLRKLFGRHWGGWHTPRHWYLFNPATVALLAQKVDSRWYGSTRCRSMSFGFGVFTHCCFTATANLLIEYSILQLPRLLVVRRWYLW
jgi:2-polyprenyl-3-methyl-5-hydroxy-6-metoxy-1,4-benzoquinol methylase